MSEATKLRARLGGVTRTYPVGHPAIAEAKRDLKAAVLEDHVRKAVSEAPRLTPEQLDRIGAILRGGAR